MPTVGKADATAGATETIDDRSLAAEAVGPFGLQAQGARRADMNAGAAAGAPL